MTDVFRECRERVSAQDAARRYGLEFDRRGWCKCPFHGDTHASMSFRDGRFRCWACNESGDSIDFTGKLLGLVIHILMSIPRWRKGGSNREYASEQYKNDNIEVYDYLVRQLRDVSEEYGIPIPDKEALAFMRYFI